MAEIQLDQVSKRFPDGTYAVRPTSLTVRDGELFILVGPSGCGKSTLLKMVVGLERPSSGEIRIDGESVTDRDPKDRNMAMVFQSYAIYPHMTVRENMDFPLKLARMDKAEIDRRVKEAAEILELNDLMERKPAALSGGQRQRVAMGRAIVRQPAAFLLDEPLSNLDAKLRTQMRTELARLQRRLGTTTLYVTHDQTEAMTLGDRVAVLRKGEVQQIGTPRELYRQPANLFVAGFIGSPAMSLLPARIEGDTLVLPMTQVPLPEPLRGSLPVGLREAVAGIRPERFGDAAETGARAGVGDAGRFRARVEAVEWLGADLYVHFDVEVGGGERLAALGRELELERGTEGRSRVVARVSADSSAAEGESMELRVDPEGILLFDAETGRRFASRDASLSSSADFSPNGPGLA